MTIVEFNEKYEEYLEKGHYGLDIYQPEVISFLDTLFENYLTKIEGFQYSQIKLKYNHARFYFTISSDIVNNAAIQYLVENTINIIIQEKYLNSVDN